MGATAMAEHQAPPRVRDLRELYQSVILDHNWAPRNYGPLEDATGQADGRKLHCAVTK